MHGEMTRGGFVFYIAFLFRGPRIETTSSLANVDLATRDGNFVHDSRFVRGHWVPVLHSTAFFFFLKRSEPKQTKVIPENHIHVKLSCYRFQIVGNCVVERYNDFSFDKFLDCFMISFP